jgi:hypothetical protein
METLIRILTEIRIEKKRRKLKLPRSKFKFNIFRREKKKPLFLNILDLKNEK